MHKFLRLFVCLAVSLAPVVVFGDDIPRPEATVPVEQGGEDRFFQEFMNMLTTLGLIVGALFFISWFLKRMVNTRIQQGNAASLIKIVEQRALSSRSSLYVVEVNNKQIVIGETAAGITLLGERSIEE